MQGHVFHLQVQLFPILGDGIQPGDNEAAQGVVVVAFRQGQLQVVHQGADGRGARDAPLVLTQRHNLRLLGLVELVVDVAHNLLQQVLHGDNALGAAVLVHHHSDVHLLLLHLFKEVVGLHGLWHKVGRAQQVL